MHHFHTSSYPDEIIHPTCARCGAPMWLTRIERDEPGKEIQTFECQACNNFTSAIVDVR